MFRHIASTIVAGAVVLCAGAAEPGYERRLIPIAAADAPGAYASRWTTHVVAVQDLAFGVEIIGSAFVDLPPDVGGAIPTRIPVPASQNEPPGTILSVRSDVAPRVHLSARLEQHGDLVSESTPFPVVSEHLFSSNTRYFSQMTKQPLERMMLRVYSLDIDHPSPVVRVRIQASWIGKQNGWTFIYDVRHQMRANQRNLSSWDGSITVPVRPLALELSIDALTSTIPDGAEIAVSITPDAPGLSTWAMLSETNNVTQRVRIITSE